MKIWIRRITAQGVDNNPNQPPFGWWTKLVDEEFTQEGVEEELLRLVKARLQALTIGAADVLEITLQLQDMEDSEIEQKKEQQS